MLSPMRVPADAFPHAAIADSETGRSQISNLSISLAASHFCAISPALIADGYAQEPTSYIKRCHESALAGLLYKLEALLKSLMLGRLELPPFLLETMEHRISGA